MAGPNDYNPNQGHPSTPRGAGSRVVTVTTVRQQWSGFLAFLTAQNEWQTEEGLGHWIRVAWGNITLWLGLLHLFYPLFTYGLNKPGTGGTVLLGFLLFIVGARTLSGLWPSILQPAEFILLYFWKDALMPFWMLDDIIPEIDVRFGSGPGYTTPAASRDPNYTSKGFPRTDACPSAAWYEQHYGSVFRTAVDKLTPEMLAPKGSGAWMNCVTEGEEFWLRENKQISWCKDTTARVKEIQAGKYTQERFIKGCTRG